MEPELFSQAGMEIACKKFSLAVNSEADHRGPSFNSLLQSRYESCDFEKKSLLLSYPITEYMRNPAGVMHGGALASAMDLTMGSLGFYMAGEVLTPTINMNVSYERPIPTGGRLMVEAVCLNCGKTMCYVTATAWLEGHPEKIVGSAAGTYFSGAANQK